MNLKPVVTLLLLFQTTMLIVVSVWVHNSSGRWIAVSFIAGTWAVFGIAKYFDHQPPHHMRHHPDNRRK
ncbi:MAG: hypothetical protein WC498_00400 [Candidatus Saccharimonadales bacterium]